MHPIIAALTFIFSPSDDWALRRAYELALIPSELPETVESYDQMIRLYPADAVSMDQSAQVAWAKLLREKGFDAEADQIHGALLKRSDLPPDLIDEIQLDQGERDLVQNRLDQARAAFKDVETRGGARALDAQVNLLICELAANDAAAARTKADALLDSLGADMPVERARFPMALASFIAEDYAQTVALLKTQDQEPRSQYFLGLAHRRRGEIPPALAAWQNARQIAPVSAWADLAQYQVAETYFGLGDDPLSRVSCERALAENPDSPFRDKFQFRLASMDVKQGDYASAMARLATLPSGGDLAPRIASLTMESLVKTGKSGELAKALAAKQPTTPTAETTFQLAWAQAFDRDHADALVTAEKGLEDFYHPVFTPRLMLLQGLAQEHLGEEAEAMAGYQTVSDRFPGSAEAARSAHFSTIAYMRLGRTREGITHGTHLWKQLPPAAQREVPDAAFWIAEANTRLGLYDEATRFYAEFLDRATPQHELIPYAQFEQAMAMAKIGRADDALAALAEFSETAQRAEQPGWVELAQVQKGNILFNEKRFEPAVTAYRQAPASPKARYYEALALYRMDYLTDAIDTWGKLVEQHPDNSYAELALFRTGRTYFELGRTSDTVATYAKFIQTYPHSVRAQEALLQSAHALYNANDPASAAPLYAQYLARYHTTEDLVAVTPYLAGCYAQLGKNLDEAEALLKGLPPTDVLASMRWERGATNYNAKKFPEANEIFGRLLADFPVDANAVTAAFFRAESLFLAGEWKDAEGAYSAYLAHLDSQKLEQAPLAMFHQAVALFKQDRLLAAAQVFERMVRTYPAESLTAEAKDNLLLCYHNLGDWDTMERYKKGFETGVLTIVETGPNTVETAKAERMTAPTLAPR